MPAALTLLDLTSRMALPAALLALTHGRPDAAIVGSAVTVVTAACRSALVGWWTEQKLTSAWRGLVKSARQQPPAALRERAQGDVTALIAALREVAVYEARTPPRIVAMVASLVLLAVAVVIFLGPAWLLFGALAAAGPAALVGLARRRLQRTYERTWSGFTHAARDAGVLIEASLELRAHAREDSFARDLVQRIDASNREERVVAALEAAMLLVPGGLGVAAVAMPLRASAAWASAAMGSAARVTDIGILGGVALTTALALVQTIMSAVTAAPRRRMVRDFLAAGQRAASTVAKGGTKRVPSLAGATIELAGVSCVHPGATDATPARVMLRWSGTGGLAVSGSNGAGKSTLALALLGLMPPAAGRITIDGVPLAELDGEDYRRRIAFVPQGAFFAPGSSIAWHMRLFAEESITDQAIDDALARVGLYDVLDHRRGGVGAPRDVMAGELSGGERQRMHLARAMVHDAELVILDEPEAALDGPGRRALSTLLDALAAERKVVVIAHDASIVPASFLQLACARGPLN